MSQLSSHESTVLEAEGDAPAAPRHEAGGQAGRGVRQSPGRSEVSLRRRLGDLSQLTKPRIALMVLITASIGYLMALRHGGSEVGLASVIAANLLPAVAVLSGITLCCMCAAVFNQVLERDTDARMERTKDRPVASGRMSVTSALLWGLALGLAGLTLLGLTSNALTTLLTAFTVVSYVLIYTPLKRVSSLSTIVGAVPGALPPVLGYAAASNRIGTEAMLLFGILFLWQLPHFLAIAYLYRDEYARAGLPMLPVIDRGGEMTFRQILLGCLALLPLGLMPTMLGVSGMVYFVGAFVTGMAFLGTGVALVIGKTRRDARRMFLMSLVYLPIVFGLMVFDQL